MDQAGVVNKYVIDYNSAYELITHRSLGVVLCLVVNPEIGEEDYRKIKALVADPSNRTRILNPRPQDAEYAQQVSHCISSLASLRAIEVRPGQTIVVEIKGPKLTKQEYDDIARIALAKGFTIKNLFRERQIMEFHAYDFVWPLACITCAVVGVLWYKSGCPPLIRFTKVLDR